MFRDLLLKEHAKTSADSDIRVLDFELTSGLVRAKVLKFGERAAEITINFSSIPTDLFNEISAEIGNNCYHLAALLAESRTQELKEVMISTLSKAPEPLLTAKVDGKETEIGNDKVLTIISKISEFFEESYWNVFLAFGVGREELLTEVFRTRRKYKKNPGEIEKEEKEISLSDDQVEKFWDAGKEIFEIKYSIRADEIPAAALRRLDSLPLSGLEENADPFFVETYERVSRLAQSYGLSLAGE